MLTDWFVHALAPVTLALASTSVVGGAGTKATITLATVAPSGGTVVTVATAPPVRISGGSNQVSLIGQIGPTSIRVPQGASQVAIDVFTTGVASLTTSTIVVKSGVDSSVATLAVRPASIVTASLGPSIVTGGQSSSLHIVLDGAAPAGTGIDVPVTISQNSAFGDGSVRTVGPVTAAPPVNAPATVHFPPGASTLSVAVPTTPVFRDQSLLLTIQLGKTVSVGLTVRAPVVTSLSLQPAEVAAGSATKALLTLSGPVPAGFVVPLATSRADVTVPSLVAVPEGAATATFEVNTSPSTATSAAATATVGVTGKSPASSSIADGTSNTISLGETSFRVSAILSVVPQVTLEVFSLRPATVKGGANVIASLKLTPAATSAATIKLTTDQPELISLPPTITVPVSAIATPFTFRTKPVSVQTPATVTATVGTQQLVVRLLVVP